ncbi:uncharacterized protein LOC111704397 isoform X2 [Eurytemora carolleeae]|uniref:uncharacterized protein LOC111704397 isoform X1 n=1 Tax=Eurytemora carolleeae TaxID=1294199 RepID=UPI000C7920E2|nr:uncharacterized protein LOC111704397 isoform X1 [Eurytemora carolleeae]XP_023332391.1 uncharacterized protein LOC111704397 isoform X2 [Eurytemora carolleeae]|eukprot:XP_023332390.1 uncharacterized protein LOC111704397 isoform X1 [Eurytemora affinis]
MFNRFLTSGLVAAAAAVMAPKSEIKFLYNFRNKTSSPPNSADNWWESSDTVRKQGMSKAVFQLQTTQVYQRGVVFVLLNPQPNGAGFAGVKTNIEGEDLTGFTGFEVLARGRGLENWKIVLTHKMEAVDPLVNYEGFFKLDSQSLELQNIRIPFRDIKPYFRGREVKDVPDLDPAAISTFGLQAYGGVYETEKQSGSGSMEIDYIAVYKQTDHSS